MWLVVDAQAFVFDFVAANAVFTFISVLQTGGALMVAFTLTFMDP